MLKKTTAFLALTLFLGVAVVWASSGVFIGVLGGFSAQKPSLENVEFSYDTTFLFGLRAGIRLWRITLEGSYFQAAHNLLPKDLLTFQWGEREVEYSYIGLTLKYDFFSVAVFHAYAALGFGYYTADIHDIDRDSEGGYNLGVGVELTLGENFALMAEGKFHHVRVSIKELDFGIGNFSICGGLSYYF
ncbi:MAG: outer membrane beta-barrel protein [Candidatus Aminicenantes bacterium]|nr:outer membrane beta-barrel protein [Candidatus Aminicenantes bacterium]